jgi:hypothetical protein
MGNKKKVADESEDNESVNGDRRTEGMDAAVFSQPIGFTPTFPAPPKYIRVGEPEIPAAMNAMMSNIGSNRSILTRNHNAISTRYSWRRNSSAPLRLLMKRQKTRR